MTQHTDMGGLVERLRGIDLEHRLTCSLGAMYNCTCGVEDDRQTIADAIEALSIPQGLGEMELHDPRVIELAGVLFKAEHPNSEWSPGRAAPCWFFRACTAINALTSAGAQ